MARLAVFCVLASFCCAAGVPAGSVPYDAETHTPVTSSGCGKNSPYKAGQTSVATGKYGGVTYTFRVYVPRSYNQNTPMPLILQHPGWGMDAKSEESGAGITAYAEELGFISVTPQGMNDNSHSGGPWYSWNAGGTTQSPGPGGATCTQAANFPSYCYNSCKPCTDKPQCDWTTCDNEVTPTGTGRTKVNGFIPSLYDTLEEQLCIDTTREFAAGESNGGMMTYQLGVDLASRLAAIAPQFGSFPKGFNLAPSVGVPVIDLHGDTDTTVPANVSLSGDGYYYTPTHEIFNGNAYSKGWKAANNCSGESSHYFTKFDGVKKLWCVSEGQCSGGGVVRCAYQGGHNWFNGGGKDNGGVVTHFLLKWKKASHIGRGYSEGEKVGPGHLLEEVAVLGDEDQDACYLITNSTLCWAEKPRCKWSRYGCVQAEVAAEADPTSVLLHWAEQPLKPLTAGHYGNPAHGCLPDEDVIPAGTGHVCAPRIATEPQVSPPTPKCKIGGVASFANGCPVDADVAESKAWPICLAKSDRIDPYDHGDFHCMLVCPCHAGSSVGGECGSESHTHCPQGARCERGELRKRDQGVCTYPLQSESESSAIDIVV